MSATVSQAGSDAIVQARDPATGEPLGSVTATTPAGIAEVVGEVAKVQPLWALLRVKDRARYMRRMAQAVIDDFDELAAALAREQGRPAAEIAALELLPAIDALIWIADDGADVLGGRRVGVNHSMSIAKRARVAYEPYGVVGVIGAGSAPFAQPLGQIAGALLAGNGVAFKPAARAALAGERIARVLARAGLPEGLVRIAHGGADVGIALAQSPVDKILFTGSPAVGRVVAGEGVSREKEVTVELGGKDAMLVLADARLPRAVAGALWAGCAGAGQARGAIERVYVAREVSERFVEGLVAAAARAARGRPRRPRARTSGRSPPPAASSTCARSSMTPWRMAPRCAAAGRSAPRLRGGLLLRTGRAHRRDARDARAARADRRTGAGGDGRRLGRRGDRAGQRQRLRARRLGVDGRPLSGAAHRPRAARRDGLAQRPPALPDRLARPVGRRGRRRAWGARSARPAAGLRAGEAHHLGPPAARGLWWGPYDEVTAHAARAVAKMRSARESDREHAWRHGALALARIGARALGHRGRRG